MLPIPDPKVPKKVFSVATATSSEEALAVLESKEAPYGALVTDVNLRPARMNGWGLGPSCPGERPRHCSNLHHGRRSVRVGGAWCPKQCLDNKAVCARSDRNRGSAAYEHHLSADETALAG